MTSRQPASSEASALTFTELSELVRGWDRNYRFANTNDDGRADVDGGGQGQNNNPSSQKLWRRLGSTTLPAFRLDVMHPTLTDFGPHTLRNYFLSNFPDFDFHSGARVVDKGKQPVRSEPRAGFFCSNSSLHASANKILRRTGQDEIRIPHDVRMDLNHSITKNGPLSNDLSRSSMTDAADAGRSENSTGYPVSQQANIIRRASKHGDQHVADAVESSESPRKRLRGKNDRKTRDLAPNINASEGSTRRLPDLEIAFGETAANTSGEHSPPSDTRFRLQAPDSGEAQISHTQLGKACAETGALKRPSKSNGRPLYVPFDYKAYFEQLPQLPWPKLRAGPLLRPELLLLPNLVTRDLDDTADVEDDPPHRGKSRATESGSLSRLASSECRERFWQWVPLPLSKGLLGLHMPDHPLPTRGWPSGIPQDIFRDVSQYLSFDDFKNLRLVNREFASQLSDLRFRSVVVPFNANLFGFNSNDVDRFRSLEKSALMLQHAKQIHKFGISFEYDLNGLTHAISKPFNSQESSWWGSFRWPAGDYPRYGGLHDLEELADSPTLLRHAMSNLTNVTELGISLDSGHGFLNGFDLSDLQVWDSRCHKDDVFGPSFSVEDVWHTYGREEIFRAGQQNTIDYMLSRPETPESKKATLRVLPVRSINHFSKQPDRPEIRSSQHTGGVLYSVKDSRHADDQEDDSLLGHSRTLRASLRDTDVGPDLATISEHVHSDIANLRTSALEPQYPLIFNGLNVAAGVTGSSPPAISVVDGVSLDSHPLQPGRLTEAQAQWLLETFWAQKAFLSSYLTSVIHNTNTLRHVHSLHISKISSGLLEILDHNEFWPALPKLRNITILVIPDWRQLYNHGDAEYRESMLIQPVEASVTLARILKTHIAPLENISKLEIGFIGGGERAKGIFARNKHIPPAPLTIDAKPWLLPHLSNPDRSNLVSLEHIEELKIVNAWVSPLMLESFMAASKDSSLKHLILDSVSMTVPHGSRQNFLTRFEDTLQVDSPPPDWIYEVTPRIPEPCVWTKVLNAITPGPTFEEYRLARDLVKEEEYVPREFAGNITKITLRSCGYARIGGLAPVEYNQNWLVMPVFSGVDESLTMRRARYSGSTMKPADRSGRDHYLLGKLTQCVHPVEKMVLESAYGFKFGWGDDISRWEAVEDGLFEGGTGRFSGTITKHDKFERPLEEDAGSSTKLKERLKRRMKRGTGSEESDDEWWQEDSDVETNILDLSGEPDDGEHTGRLDDIEAEDEVDDYYDDMYDNEVDREGNDDRGEGPSSSASVPIPISGRHYPRRLIPPRWIDRK